MCFFSYVGYICISSQNVNLVFRIYSNSSIEIPPAVPLGFKPCVVWFVGSHSLLPLLAAPPGHLASSWLPPLCQHLHRLSPVVLWRPLGLWGSLCLFTCFYWVSHHWRQKGHILAKTMNLAKNYIRSLCFLWIHFRLFCLKNIYWASIMCQKLCQVLAVKTMIKIYITFAFKTWVQWLMTCC